MNDREFLDIEILNIRERKYRCLCSYYVINTNASLMYELKKIGKIFTSKFVGPWVLVLLKNNNLLGCGLTNVKKHCSRKFVPEKRDLENEGTTFFANVSNYQFSRRNMSRDFCTQFPINTAQLLFAVCRNIPV
jgi:hypothetical protein